MRKLLLLILSLGIINLVYADAENFSFKTSNTVINVKTPSGFFESSYIDPEIEEMITMLFPRELLNVHSVLVPKDFYEKNDRYIILVTLTELNNINISKKDFKDLKDTLREEQFTLMNEILDDANKLIDSSVSDINSDWGTDINFSVNETTPLGVFIDSNKAISFNTIMNGNFSVSGDEENLLVVNSTTFIHIKNRLIIAYVYSNFNSSTDIIWLEAKTKELVELMLKVN